MTFEVRNRDAEDSVVGPSRSGTDGDAVCLGRWLVDVEDVGVEGPPRLQTSEASKIGHEEAAALLSAASSPNRNNLQHFLHTFSSVRGRYWTPQSYKCHIDLHIIPSQPTPQNTT